MAENLDQIIDMIKNLDLQDDGIRMNHKIKSIELDFCNLVKDEQMLSDSMDYINEKVLEDSDAALKFAMLFSSRNFDSLAMHDTKVRCKMLNILQKNFSSAETFRKENIHLLYNSITLLGEYYHRVRLADGSPIDILGESLLQLLIQEIEFDIGNKSDNVTYPNIDLKLSKLILSQVTLNGSILRSNHKNDLNTLLYYVRKNLIEQTNIETTNKALLLMALDLYYNNFNSLTPALEEMYTKYLIEENKQGEIIDEIKSVQEIPEIKTKKWSEQVCEDSMLEFEATDAVETTSNNNSVCESPNNTNNQEEFQYQSLPPRPAKYDEEDGEIKPPPRRDYFPRRPNNNRSLSPQDSQFSNQSRAANVQQRLYHNNTNNKFMNRNNRKTHRYSGGNFDEDRSSVRSDGGSIRLYNAGDRNPRTDAYNVDHSRDRTYNTEGNNWDRGSGYHTYDGRRRSTSRNNQREGSYNNNNSNNNNRNRNTYDRPPRFRNMEIPSWRNGSQENKYNRSGSKGPDSRSSSINRTFPRSNRQGSYDAYNGDSFRGSKTNLQQQREPSSESVRYDNGGTNYNASDKQNNETTNDSDLSSSNNYRPQQSRNFGRSNNDQRYGSHYSLSSADSAAWQRRGRQKNRNAYRRKSQDWGDTHSLHENDNVISDNNKWNDSKRNENNEIVKNARNTTKYMEYLSQKN